MPEHNKDNADDKKQKGGNTPLDHPKKPAEILKTDKADDMTNPLHADLSEKPENENRGVRHSEENEDNKNDT